MLSIQPSKSKRTTPNLLPARIHHNGPINEAQRYWKPSTDEKGTQHVYFRGRHLHGTSLPLPANYTGAVLHITNREAPQSNSQQRDSEDQEDDEAEGEESEAVEVKIAEQVGEFDEVVVWGHGGQADRNQNMFIRGMNEWVGFAESMHVEEEEEEEREKGKEEDKNKKQAS